MPLLSNALTTVSRFKTFAGINNNSQDTLIERLINAVTEFVEQYINWSLLQTTHTNEVYDGTGTRQLVLNAGNISSVSLQVRSGELNIDSWVTVNTEMYFAKTHGILESVGWKFQDAPQHYRVTYTSGYAYDQTNATLESLGLGDLEYAVWKLLQGAVLNRKDNPKVQSETIGNYSVTFRKEAEMDAEIKAVLDSYSRPQYA